MKKYFTFVLPVAVVALLLSSYSGNQAMYPGGAPAGYTGSPADNKDCTFCHNGNASTVANWITSDIGPDGYTAGQTYTITVTVTGSGSKGFEVSPQNQSGEILGTLVAGSGNKLVGGGKYVTHTNSSNSNPKVWTFQWTAPAAGSGELTMYGAFALNTSSTKLSTLVIPENTATGIEEQKVSRVVKVYPDPADRYFNVNFALDDASYLAFALVNSSTGIKDVLMQGFFPRGSNSIRIDCSGQASGLYILLIENKEKKLESKVLIRH